MEFVIISRIVLNNLKIAIDEVNSDLSQKYSIYSPQNRPIYLLAILFYS